jgi:hypothetical protein
MMVWQKLMMAEAAPAGYSCTITIGTPGGGFYGYDTGALIVTFGSISAEPISSETLTGVVWSTFGSIVAFDGDVLSLVGSLDVWIGGVDYGGSGDWEYNTGYPGLTAVETVGYPGATSGTILLELK